MTDENYEEDDIYPESLSGHEDDELFMTSKEIEDLIKESLKNSSTENKVIRKRSEIEKAMVGTLSEFMDNFIILGYDLNHKAIEPIFYARNDMGADALTQYMQNYFIAMMKDSRR